MSLDPALGERIRSAREARGWNQQDLAAALGVAKRTVGNWERGRAPKQHVGALERVLQVRLRGTADTRNDGLDDYDDAELLAALAQRLAAARRRIRELEATVAELRDKTGNADD